MFLRWGIEVRVGGVGRTYFTSVNIHSELSFLRERKTKRHDVVLHSVADVFIETFLLIAVTVERRHEVRERARHAELNNIKNTL